MDKRITANNLLILLLVSSSFALIGAYISQYFFDLQPCILCLYQRKPFFAIIALTATALVFFKSTKNKNISILLCALLLFLNSSIALYHTGVEKKILKGPTTCSSKNLNDINNIEELKIALNKIKAVKCDEPSFIFLTLSMASWNVIYCISLFFIILFLYRKKEI